MEVFIGVDSGRDTVKGVMLYDGEYEDLIFKTKYCDVNFNKLKNIPILNWNNKNDIIVSVDNDSVVAIGDVCYKIESPENIMFVTNDNIYLENSIKYTLVCIGKLIMNKGINTGDVVNVYLGINLTDNNIGYADKVVNKLMGEHNVLFYKSNGNVLGNVKINVLKVGYFYQGWVSLFSICLDDDFNINKEIVEKNNLIVDMGRKTLDIVYVHKLSPAKIRSYNYGVEKYYVYIRDILLRDYNISKMTNDIEMLINKEIVEGFSNVKKRASDILFREINNVYNEDFSDIYVDDIYVTGGGSILFKNYFDVILNKPKYIPNSVFSNCYGLVKLMYRKIGLTKTGL